MKTAFRTSVAVVTAGFICACGGTAQDSSAGDGDSTDSCAQYENDASSRVEVLLINQRSTPIFLGSRVSTCGKPPLFQVADDAGNPLAAHGPDCSGVCQDYTEGSFAGCLPICVYPELIRVGPGESHLTWWDARVTHEETMPATCNNIDDTEIECVRRRAIEPSTYTFSAQAGTEATCGTPNTCDDCDPNTEPCVGDYVVAGELLEGEVTVELDASYGLDENGEPAPGASNAVEIVFTS